jgi:cytochrome P450
VPYLVGFSLDSQNKEASVIELFHTILYSHTIERDSWNPVKRFNARQKRLTAIHQLNQSLSKIIRERFEVLHRDNLNINNKGTLNIMDMVLRGRIEETRKSGADPSKALNKDFMHAAITTAKSYLLGGIGTTSDTLSFTFMLLSTDSKAVHCLREEHDRVFTAGIDATFKMLQEDSQKISELKYTNNVLKEALRLYPVGGTVRAADPTGFFIYNGRQYPTKSQM